MDTLTSDFMALTQAGLNVSFVPKSSMQPSKPKRRKRLTNKFLKGPIPLPLIKQATELPGKAWHVYAALWYLKGIKRTSTVTLTQVVLNDFGVSRYAKYRALDSLAKSGLISYLVTDGKNPSVTLLGITGIEP